MIATEFILTLIIYKICVATESFALKVHSFEPGVRGQKIAKPGLGDFYILKNYIYFFSAPRSIFVVC